MTRLDGAIALIGLLAFNGLLIASNFVTVCDVPANSFADGVATVFLYMASFGSIWSLLEVIYQSFFRH